MSASSPAINIGTNDAARPADVRATVSRLYFQRRFWRAGAEASLALTCALALLCLTAVADHVWMFTRAVRIALVAPVLLGAATFMIYALRLLLKSRPLMEMARVVERATGSTRNTLVTFAEKVDGAKSVENSNAEPYMLAQLEAQARRELASIDERAVAPRNGARRGFSALALVALLLFALRVAAPLAFAREMKRILWWAQDNALVRRVDTSERVATDKEAMTGVVVEEFRVRVVPPAYSGLSVEERSDDAPLRALAGSQIEVSLTARGEFEGATLNFNGTTASMRALGQGKFSGAFIASASGTFETRIIADERRAPAALVRAVEVYADAVPEVNISEPAGDQLLRAVPTAPVTVRWAARDDLGLASVILKYIKSRGEGDAAKFTNGEVALRQVERINAREWRGAAALDLARLDVRAGDTLVFWTQARDRNPSVNSTGRSASLAIAIAGLEAPKLNLNDLRPNEIGRFLLSERQIIISTEKLHSERARLAQPEVQRRANEIAADQREFKNSFNDYINSEGDGHTGMEGAIASVEDQVRAAENERTEVHVHAVPEPPAGAPASVRELTYAIRAMWDAEEALSAGDTAKALVHEREALARLKRAQTAVRYVPPIAAQHKPIDLKRRYAGELAEIKTRLEKLARRPASKESGAVRAALTDAYAALSDLQSTLGVPASTRAGAVARAQESARAAANRLVAVGGNHAATLAEAAGQLRIVETELARTNTGGTSEEFAARIAKPLALLTQAASSLFAIAESSTRASAAESNTLMPTDDARAAEYFRRLAGSRKP